MELLVTVLVIVFAVGSLGGLFAYVVKNYQSTKEFCEKHDLDEEEISKL